jgi:hypothetical protein
MFDVCSNGGATGYYNGVSTISLACLIECNLWNDSA